MCNITLLLGDNHNNNSVAIPWLLICPVCSISSLQLLWINRSISISSHLSTSHLSIGPADPSRHTEPWQHLTNGKRWLWVRCCSPAWLRKSLCPSLLSKTFTCTPVCMPWILQRVLQAPSSGWVGAGNVFSYLQSATAPGAHCVIPARPRSALICPRSIRCHWVQPNCSPSVWRLCEPICGLRSKRGFCFPRCVYFFVAHASPPASCRGWREKYLTCC